MDLDDIKELVNAGWVVIIGYLIWVTIWMAGVVLAKGFWSTLFAVITGGLYSYYLIIERVIT